MTQYVKFTQTTYHTLIIEFRQLKNKTHTDYYGKLGTYWYTENDKEKNSKLPYLDLISERLIETLDKIKDTINGTSVY